MIKQFAWVLSRQLAITMTCIVCMDIRKPSRQWGISSCVPLCRCILFFRIFFSTSHPPNMLLTKISKSFLNLKKIEWNHFKTNVVFGKEIRENKTLSLGFMCYFFHISLLSLCIINLAYIKFTHSIFVQDLAWYQQ